jgi:hypothetical protein
VYSEKDLQSAVSAGVLSHDAAQALRSYVANGTQAAGFTPVADEEQFRLVTGFNDIFVSIATIILLVAVGSIGQSVGPMIGGLLVVATTWGLAEFFTRKRRMALPSIILLLAFVGGVASTVMGLAESILPNEASDRMGAVAIALSGLVCVGATYAHWRRFMVPITIAAGAGAVAATVIALLLAAFNPSPTSAEIFLMLLVLTSGLALFAFAMRWDMSDRARETRRSDVAFWLHLLAAPMIAHPIFWMLGVTSGEGNAGAALSVLGVYILMGLIAIAVDRRALLVSALAYVLFALALLFRKFGVVELNVAVTALIIGSALLCLSAFWAPIRRFVVDKLPSALQARLPVTHLAPSTLPA